jgi:hypothetical protein
VALLLSSVRLAPRRAGRYARALEPPGRMP